MLGWRKHKLESRLPGEISITSDNVVHWRREWKTTSVFLPREPHEQYEKAKYRTLKDELPRSIGAQYATGDHCRNNSRKNEEM